MTWRKELSFSFYFLTVSVDGWESLNECKSCKLAPYQPLTVFTLGMSSKRGGRCPISFIIDASRTGNSFRRNRYDCCASPSRARIEILLRITTTSIRKMTNQIERFSSSLNRSVDIWHNGQLDALNSVVDYVEDALNAWLIVVACLFSQFVSIRYHSNNHRQLVQMSTSTEQNRSFLSKNSFIIATKIKGLHEEFKWK